MDDRPNVWEKHAEKMRRQEELRKFDEALMNFQKRHPIRFLLFTAAIGVIAGGIVLGILHVIDKLSGQ